MEVLNIRSGILFEISQRLLVKTRFRLRVLRFPVLQLRHASSRYRYILCDRDYLNESQLRRIQNKLAVVGVLVVLALVAIQPLAVTSQTTDSLQLRFGETIAMLHQAESAGATPSEIGALVALLNKALELNGEALKLTAPDEVQRRAELVAQVDQILMTVENRAADLTALASQRSYTNKVLTYVWGAIAAVLGTILYAFTMSFYRKYRIKRTFQMRISRK